MSQRDGTEPVDDDEYLYRRVPYSWYENQELLRQAFRPNVNDVTGISLTRAEPYSTAEAEARRGRSGKSYFVAKLRAGDLRLIGIEIVPKPIPENPGHVELPDIRWDNHGESRVKELERKLATQLTLEVLGPFEVP